MSHVHKTGPPACFLLVLGLLFGATLTVSVLGLLSFYHACNKCFWATTKWRDTFWDLPSLRDLPEPCRAAILAGAAWQKQEHVDFLDLRNFL